MATKETLKRTLSSILQQNKQFTDVQNNFIANIIAKPGRIVKDNAEAIKFWSEHEDLQNMPVIVCYHDTFGEDNARVGRNINELMKFAITLGQPQGYYKWNYPKDCHLVWLQYFMMQCKNYIFGHNNDNQKEYIDSINSCLNKAGLGTLTAIRRDAKDILVLTKDNTYVEPLKLPYKLRKLFNIVFDIANRAFLLNENGDPTGWVLFDTVNNNIDIKLLQKVFPHLQFVV